MHAEGMAGKSEPASTRYRRLNPSNAGLSSPASGRFQRDPGALATAGMPLAADAVLSRDETAKATCIRLRAFVQLNILM